MLNYFYKYNLIIPSNSVLLLSEIHDDMWNKDVIKYDNIKKMPHVKELTNWFKRLFKAEIGDVRIERMQGRTEGTPHVDSHAGSDLFDEFHIPITTNDACFMFAAHAGDGEFTHMESMKLYWFNNKTMHYMRNYGVVDVVHLVISARVKGIGRCGELC